MYVLDVTIVLMYGSHNTIYTSFRMLTVVNGTPGMGRYILVSELRVINT